MSVLLSSCLVPQEIDESCVLAFRAGRHNMNVLSYIRSRCFDKDHMSQVSLQLGLRV